ncbi:MAG: ABC transporter ATP-binding protein [Firmicutes bacterium]|nr:ABC transporter ATP-binding protein [Bacillota bacterium]
MNFAIKCENVVKSFWEDKEADKSAYWLKRLRPGKSLVRAVDDVSIQVQRGEIFGLLGPNGSGKSTLIRLMATLLLPDSGTVTVLDHDVVKETLAVRKVINRVSVDAAFFKKLSAHENLLYAARLYDVDSRLAAQTAAKILRRLGFKENKIYAPMENLSRGMQQKVAIARALLTSPVVMLLDEPTTGLDPKSKRDVQEFVREIQGEHDATIILTTHDMFEAERLSDRIAIIDNGRIEDLDTAAGLKAKAGVDSMDDVFFALTGKEWEEAIADEC